MTRRGAEGDSVGSDFSAVSAKREHFGAKPSPADFAGRA
jgi:hypothetical protein